MTKAKLVNRISKNRVLVLFLTMAIIVPNLFCVDKDEKKQSAKKCDYSYYDTNILFRQVCGNCHVIVKDEHAFGVKNIFELAMLDSADVANTLLDSTHSNSLGGELNQCEKSNIINYLKEYVRINSSPMP